VALGSIWPSVQNFVRWNHRTHCRGRWKAAVLEQLFQGTKRFSELKRGITGITQRTLAQQLRDLQSTGIVDRTVYRTRRREWYTPLLLSENLCGPLLDTMCHWGKSHSLPWH